MEKVYIGVDIGGMSLKAGPVTEEGKILFKDTEPTNCKETGKEGFLKDIKNLILRVINKIDKNLYEIKGIGFGMPGFVSPSKVIVEYSPNLFLEDVHLGEYLQDLNIPCFISNDANVAALAEAKFGAGKDFKNVILLTLGTGVGGGVIIDGKLFEGVDGKGTELGHATIMIGGDLCNCGRKGCYERYASATALLNQTKQAMEEHKESKMWDYCKGDIKNVSGLTSFECAKAGDKTAIDVVNRYVMYVSEGILNYLNIFRPNAVLIGGGISNQGDYFINMIKKYVKDANYGFVRAPEVEILTASLKNDAGIIGAACLAMDGTK